MKLLLNPETQCTLKLKGKSIDLTAAELSGLMECLADSGKEPKEILPRALFKQLFKSGLLELAEIQHAADTAYWKEILSSVSLSPYLKLDLSFSAGSAGMHTTEPAIGLFLAPEFVDGAGRLQSEIRTALSTAAKACAVRTIPFPHHRGLKLVHQVAFEWFNRHPDWNHWLKWGINGEGSLSLTVPNYAKLSESTSLRRWSAAIRISHYGEHEPRTREVVVPIEELPTVAVLMDILRAGSNNLDERILSSASLRLLLAAIESVGGFVPRGSVPILLMSEKEKAALAITHMGHASLIVQAGTQRILIDPWLFNWDRSFEKQPIVGSQLGRVDAIFFTHHHNDHLNSASLLSLPHDVPVFVPCRTGVNFEPQTANFLRLIGFRDVRELAHGRGIDVGDGLTVEAVPFFGEGQNHLGFGANCYLLSRLGRNVLVHADASPDSTGRSIVSSGALRQIVARRGPIDVVFGTWWQERKFLFELSPLAIFQPHVRPEDWLNDSEMCDCPAEFLSELVEGSGARLMLTYAESGKECFLPTSMMSSYVPSVSFLWKPLEEVQKTVQRQTGIKMLEAQPYLTATIPEHGAPYIDQSMVGESRKSL